ncbi:hypothetical protein RHMOL_Rhmol05G0111200 [Rhododendron molle]|uniref:Uncharacterized protein n=1 Tax=Rhododendron molle TaxID=49168 RepID=A0ACC0NNR7_RHOML|nr:hypothetical protein RHMOL_Rhmol05G0111200 [Rhododendron molle]
MVSLFMALEYMPMNLDSHMDLVNYNHKYPAIIRRQSSIFYHHFARTISFLQHFMKQILLGISYCHENKVLHRDLKPKNLLIDPENDTVKICDFGLVKSFVCPSSSAFTAQVATLRYRAPKVLMGSTKYTTAMDMWAVGCTIAEMLCLKQLFRGYSEIQVMNQIFSKLG